LKEQKQVTSIRIYPSLKAQIKELADSQNRSFNNMIEQILISSVELKSSAKAEAK
jgi:predicted transcriptional regulator